MKARRRPRMPSAIAAGSARQSSPVSTYAEDFSLLVRRKRLRITRGQICVLN
jgi:hypothetical protein